MKHTLEQQKLFPYVAWSCVAIGFVAVLHLANNLTAAGEQLQTKSNMNVEALEEFEAYNRQ